MTYGTFDDMLNDTKRVTEVIPVGVGNNSVGSGSFVPIAVPEPTTLLGLGIAGLGVMRRRQTA